MKSAPFILSIAGAALVLSSTAQAEPGKGYELKNRSSFHTDMDARIPFWPIGWKRPQIKADGSSDAPVAAAAKVQLQAGHFNVSSILLGNPALATINGRTFGEGELLPVIYGTERLRVVVRAIRDGGVTLDFEEQHIFVPMRRAELGAKQAQQASEPSEFAIRIGPAQPK
jgi:hypothetical protein